MAVKKGGLGKGLDSLIPSGAPKNKKNITEEKKQPVKVVEKVYVKVILIVLLDMDIMILVEIK